jgi:hypothetical protein
MWTHWASFSTVLKGTTSSRMNIPNGPKSLTITTTTTWEESLSWSKHTLSFLSSTITFHTPMTNIRSMSWPPPAIKCQDRSADWCLPSVSNLWALKIKSIFFSKKPSTIQLLDAMLKPKLDMDLMSEAFKPPPLMIKKHNNLSSTVPLSLPLNSGLDNSDCSPIGP